MRLFEAIAATLADDDVVRKIRFMLAASAQIIFRLLFDYSEYLLSSLLESEIEPEDLCASRTNREWFERQR